MTLNFPTQSVSVQSVAVHRARASLAMHEVTHVCGPRGTERRAGRSAGTDLVP